jgi:hypothetical protein
VRPHFLFICLVILLAGTGSFLAQIPCGLHHNAFTAGEELNYKVVYNWGPIWLESAEASFKVKPAEYNGKGSYLLSGTGSTYPKYDWFYKVRDVFETYVDSLSLRPLKFQATIQEGSKKDKHIYIFNDARQKAYTVISYGTKRVKVDTVKLSTCSIDVLTAIYYARSIDYSNCKKNDTVGISLLVDGKLYSVYVRFLGREKFKSKELGTYQCIKFSPLLIEGTIFKKGEGMTVWVSDDKNKLPIYIETEIVVGSIKVRLMSYKGLRNPQDARLPD